MTMSARVNKLIFIAMLVLTSINPSLTRAESQDSCAIWLCLPGGFPAGCESAYREFRHRLKKGKPPLPDLASCSTGPHGEHSSGRYETGYEPYEPCKEGFTLADYSDGDTQRPAVCMYNFAYTYNETQRCEGQGITVTERNCFYPAVKRPRPHFIKMWVDEQYIGQYFY